MRLLQVAGDEHTAAGALRLPAARAESLVAVEQDLVVQPLPGVFHLVAVSEVRLDALFENFQRSRT